TRPRGARGCARPCSEPHDWRHRRRVADGSVGREYSRRNGGTGGLPEQRHAELHQHGRRGGGGADPGMNTTAAHVDLARPFPLVAPALGFLSGAATAIGAFPREPWSQGLVVAPLIGSVMAAVLNAGNNALNQIYDLDIDRTNKPNRPLPAGRLTLRQA